MEQKETLKSCPFCGDTENISIESPNYEMPFDQVVCTICDAAGPGHTLSREEAIAAWNKRA